MVKRRVLSPQSIWDTEAVTEALNEAGVKNVELHTMRMWHHLVRHPQSTWHDVTDFPKAAKEVLDAKFVKFTSKLHAVQRSEDGETLKLLLSLQDGLRVESVVMIYDTSQQNMQPEEEAEENDDVRSMTSTATTVTGRVRSTLCVSSQVGCQMGCTFCATGTMGLQGHLTAGEIVEQLAFAFQFTPIRNVVFMGMGEPLDNYDAMRSAVAMMTDGRFFALQRKHVTVSTVGVVPKIPALGRDLPGVSLALSLHAPTQELRQTIVPSAKAWKLPKLMEAIATYQAETNQKIFVEYVMLREVNDNEEQAHQLGELLKGFRVTINLIPWNPVLSPDMTFEAPGMERTAAFRDIVKSHGLPCTIRQEKGQDISGACGQLVIEHQGKGKKPKGLQDIEEVAARLLVA